MITLLSEQDRARVKTEYRLRLFTVAALFAAGISAAAAVALLPSYFSARLAGTAALEEQQLLGQALENPALASAGKSVRSSVVLFAGVATASAAPRPSSVAALIVGARRPGITVTRLEFSSQGKTTVVRLSGVAAAREGLLQFRQALGALPGVSSVDLPIENLAKAAAIEYAITVTMNFSPPAQ